MKRRRIRTNIVSAGKRVYTTKKSLSGAAQQRIIKIIPKPNTKRNVPSPPEFSNCFRKIRKIKILRNTDA